MRGQKPGFLTYSDFHYSEGDMLILENDEAGQK